MKIDWAFLDTFNGTAFKGWSAGWLWIGTFAVWAVVAVLATHNAHDTPNEWLYGWLAGLSAYSGISAFQYRSMRETDYGALDRKAKIEAAKQTSTQDGAHG